MSYCFHHYYATSYFHLNSCFLKSVSYCYFLKNNFLMKKMKKSYEKKNYRKNDYSMMKTKNYEKMMSYHDCKFHYYCLMSLMDGLLN